MRNLMDFKTFEAEQIGAAPLVTSKEDLTAYYKCNKCNALFKTFNDEATNCKFCHTNDISKISDFEYMTLVKDRLEPDEYKEEIKDKKKRGEELVDLVNVGIMNQEKRYRKSLN